MTSTPTPRGEGEVGGLMQQHQRWAAARARMNAAAGRERPKKIESPIARRRREAREAQYAAMQAQLDAIAAQIKPGASPLWRTIIEEVARKHFVTVERLLKAKRSKTDPAMRARDEAIWRIRREVTVSGEPISLPQIGQRFGGRDHTTVLAAIRRHEHLAGIKSC